MSETPKQRLEAAAQMTREELENYPLHAVATHNRKIIEATGNELNALQGQVEELRKGQLALAQTQDEQGEQVEELRKQPNVSKPIIIKRDGPKVTDRIRDGGIGQWDRHDA